MTSGRKILLVDDDEALRSTLAEQLQLHEEFTTAEAAIAADGLAALNTPHPTWFQLDSRLPTCTVPQLSGRMHSHGSRPRGTFLTAQDPAPAPNTGTNAAATDYDTNPSTVHNRDE